MVIMDQLKTVFIIEVLIKYIHYYYYYYRKKGMVLKSLKSKSQGS